MQIYYRPTDTADREERAEDDALRDALVEVFGARVTLLGLGDEFPEDGLHLGRRKSREKTLAQYLPYWEDPGFLSGVSRRFTTADFTEAEELIKQIHAEGKDAVVKAREMKLMVKRVPRGQTLFENIADLAYTFIDNPESLMVQEFVTMRHEHRFVVIGGEIVAHSPVLITLTPQDRIDGIELSDGSRVFGEEVGDLHFETPSSEKPPIHDPELTRRMIAHVEAMVEKSRHPDSVVDVCELEDGRIEAIEFNPMVPGGFGLYACDPVAIARACEDLTQRADPLKVKLGAFVAMQSVEDGPDGFGDFSFFDS